MSESGKILKEATTSLPQSERLYRPKSYNEMAAQVRRIRRMAGNEQERIISQAKAGLGVSTNGGLQRYADLMHRVSRAEEFLGRQAPSDMDYVFGAVDNNKRVRTRK